jgi:hypothetical protein
MGLLHVRVQTWRLPYFLYVCLNGRQWLARHLDLASLGYHSAKNAGGPGGPPVALRKRRFPDLH